MLMTELGIKIDVLFFDVVVHFFFKFFEFILNLLDVLVVDLFELLFLKSLAYIGENG